MSRYIEECSISVGYNNTGQQFFDILNEYERYIHSYFFSFDRGMIGNQLNTDNVVSSLMVDTYNFPANLLFNDIRSETKLDEFITLARSIVNLRSVTVLDGKTAKEVKKLYPDLEVHLSVRYFDYKDGADFSHLLDSDEDIRSFVDVINISGAFSFGDHSLISKIHRYGMKVKIILNEGCIIGRFTNFNKLEGFENETCRPCTRVCDRVVDKYPWMDLTRILLYKEQLQYYDADIIKLSTRNLYDNSIIDGMLNSIVDDSTTRYIGNAEIKNYNEFLKWCKIKSHCNGNCIECRQCEIFYPKIIGV